MFFFNLLAKVPKLADIKGNQYLMMTKSGSKLFIRFAVKNQLNGLTEFNILMIFGSSGLLSSENCVLPGNKKSGYCILKVTINASCPPAMTILIPFLYFV